MSDMPTKCFIAQTKEEKERPGAMFTLGDSENKEHWFVRLPNYGLFRIYGLSSDGTPWDVRGELPNITMSPSINFNRGQKGGWHGYLQNGVLTDDLEGRTYEEQKPWWVV